jgi:hypothetical protein
MHFIQQCPASIWCLSILTLFVMLGFSQVVSPSISEEPSTEIYHQQTNENPPTILLPTMQDHAQAFKALCHSLVPVTDKVTVHTYQIMYGLFLAPLRAKPIKMLEIGLGCDMSYGPGASLAVWKKYLHADSEIWMADSNQACVDKFFPQHAGKHVVVGDQSNLKTVQAWSTQIGSDLDLIIDDGGHSNVMIKTSLDALWPSLKVNGGLYFIEDMQVGKDAGWGNGNGGGLHGNLAMADVLQIWIEFLLLGTVNQQYPPPSGLQSIFCQREACVLIK